MDIDIVQSIPIEVLAMSTVEHYCEPNVPAPQIAIEMPPLRALRSIVDRLKSIHKTITIEASAQGTLALRIESNSLTLQTLFAHLRYREDLIGDEDDEDGDLQEPLASSASVTVESKVLGKAILVDGNSTLTVLCCAYCFDLALCISWKLMRVICRHHGEPRHGAAFDPGRRLWLLHVLHPSTHARRALASGFV